MAIDGLTNFSSPVPGTDYTVYVGSWDREPCRWIYSMWSDKGDDETLVSSGEFDVTDWGCTPEQFARIVYLVDVEYKEI